MDTFKPSISRTPEEVEIVVKRPATVTMEISQGDYDFIVALLGLIPAGIGLDLYEALYDMSSSNRAEMSNLLRSLIFEQSSLNWHTDMVDFNKLRNQ